MFRQWEKHHKKPHPQLYPEPLSQLGEIVWDLFLSMRAGFTSETAIPFMEMKAWAELYDERLEPWQVDGIRALDDCYRKQINDDLKRFMRASRGGK